MKKIRVLIVEDSTVVRQFLEYIIGTDPRLEVAAAVGTAEEAIRLLPRVSPDVISMDIRLPGMDGFEATRRIMSEHPLPIVVVSASVEAEDLKITMNALRAGALTVVEKPRGTTHGDYQALAERLCTQLAIMSEIKVLRQRTQRPDASQKGSAAPPNPVPRNSITKLRMAGVVASTGGPQALVKLLGGLGPDFPLPILLVQHITSSFLFGFVDWLNGICPLTVVVAKAGDIPMPGRVYVAPPDHHLQVETGSITLGTGPLVCMQRPSGTVLFQSMARSMGRQSLGVLLTGMGDDGAEGLLELRRAGGYTLAEDETTAVVYGMPAAAAQRGGVCELLPLPAIAPRMLELTSARKEVC